MSRYVDSRDPVGIGYPILQDFGYQDSDLPDHARGAIVGVRVIGRAVGDNEWGDWKPDDFVRGPIGGAHYWDRTAENAGAYRFAWPVVTATAKASATTVGGNGGGGRAPSDDTADGGNPKAPYLVGVLEGKDPYPTLPDGSPDWEQIYNDAASGKTTGITGDKLHYIGGVVANLAGRNFFGNGVNPIMFGGRGGAFGLGVNPIRPFPNAGAVGEIPGIFGLNVPPILGFTLSPNDEYFGPNVSGTSQVGNVQLGNQENADKKNDAGENLAHIWFADSDTRVATVFYPTDSSRLPDRRYFSKQSYDPIGWPTFPRGYSGISLVSSIDHQQRELYHPADPRLVAPNFAGPPSMGTPVADMGGADHSLSLDRHAPLQSMMRVLRGPTGSLGMLKMNGDKKQTPVPRNWIGWNIGPSGQGDVCGGLVVDLPTARRGHIYPDPRVLGAVSCHYGGPLDVGTFVDKHQLGKDLDGNAINPVHISTDALYRRRDSTHREDGPLYFEASWQDGSDYDVVTKVHLAYDDKSAHWGWWSTCIVYVPEVVTKVPDPGPGTPGGGKPPGAVTPEPEAGRPGGADPPGGRVPGEDPPYVPPPPAWYDHPVPPVPDPGPTDPDPSGDPSGYRDPADEVGSGLSMSRQYGHPAATVRELLVPGVAARPQMMKRGDKDLRYANRPSKTAIRRQDWQAPTTLRIDAWGAQGGKQADGYLDTGGEWAYTQPPGRSRSLSGTSPGGMLLLPSETDMQDIDEDFAPAGVTTSAVYLAAGPGACIGVGYPELASGGLRTGVSFCGTADGDMEFYGHDAVGGKTLLWTLDHTGPSEIVVTTAIPYIVAVGVGTVLATTTLTVTLPDAALNEGRRIRTKLAAAAGVVTLTAVAGNVDDQATQLIGPYETIVAVSDGADWWVV